MLYTQAVRKAQEDAILSEKPIIHLCTYDRSDFFAVCSGAFFRREEGTAAREHDYIDLTRLAAAKETLKDCMDRVCVLYAMADGDNRLSDALCSLLSDYVSQWKIRACPPRCRVVLGGTSLNLPEEALL